MTISPWVSTSALYAKEKENLFTLYCVLLFKVWYQDQGGHQAESYHTEVLSCFTDRIISKQIIGPGKKERKCAQILNKNFFPGN